MNGMLVGLICCLVIATVLPAEVLRVEELREVYGRRFCEVAWRTSLACETRILLSDGGDECVLRPAKPERARDHRLLVPLGAARELSYSIVFPDGSRSEPRKLHVASSSDAPIVLHRSVASDGTLELVASAGAEMKWRLTIPGKGELEPPGGPDFRALSARFRMETLGPDASLEGVVIHASGVDSGSEVPAGPILGNRRLARQAVDALRQMDIGALLSQASDSKMTRARLVEAFREQCRKSGLDRLLPEAAARVAGIAADPAVGSELTIPLTFGMCRLGDLDWAVRARGWEPVTGVEEMAGVMGRFGRERVPPEAAYSAFAQDWGRLTALAQYPQRLAGGVEGLTFARLTNPEQFKTVLEEAQDKLPGAAAFVLAFVQIQLAMWSEMELPPELLGSPDGRVTLYLQAAFPDPMWVIYARLDDRVILPFRVDPEDYRAVIQKHIHANAMDPKQFNWIWMACATSARFLHPGKNNWVLYAGSAGARPMTALMGVVREMRLARGTLPER